MSFLASITRVVLLLCFLWALPSFSQQKYALVIGISSYSSLGQNEDTLRFAHRDAGDFAAFIETQQGGSFPVGNVHLVTNQDATRDRLFIEFGWLRERVGPNDLVYVFFAGHGIEYQNRSYFLPADTTNKSIDSKGIPMEDFFARVTRNLSAKQVVVFIDACHSAASVGARSPITIDIEKEWSKSNTKQGQIAQGQIAMALVSSLAHEKSWEDPDLGGGHGLFTWYLLEGLRGAAPRNQLGFITAGNLWSYVKDRVGTYSKRKQFASSQTPFASPGFIPDFILAYPDSAGVSQPLPAETLPAETTAVPSHPKEPINNIIISTLAQGQQKYARFLRQANTDIIQMKRQSAFDPGGIFAYSFARRAFVIPPSPLPKHAQRGDHVLLAGADIEITVSGQLTTDCDFLQYGFWLDLGRPSINDLSNLSSKPPSWLPPEKRSGWEDLWHTVAHSKNEIRIAQNSPPPPLTSIIAPCDGCSYLLRSVIPGQSDMVVAIRVESDNFIIWKILK